MWRSEKSADYFVNATNSYSGNEYTLSDIPHRCPVISVNASILLGYTEVIRRRLHGFRHFNAVLSLRRGIGVFDVARNTASAIADFPAGLNGDKVKLVTRSRVNATTFRPYARSPGDNPGFS
jgi:hypothetical protein